MNKLQKTEKEVNVLQKFIENKTLSNESLFSFDNSAHYDVPWKC